MQYLVDKRNHVVLLAHDARHHVVLSQPVLHRHAVDLVLVQADQALHHVVPRDGLQGLQVNAQLLSTVKQGVSESLS
jgi:hypothetical protein